MTGREIDMHRAFRRTGAALFLLVLGAIGSTTTAFARNEDGSWEVGAYIFNTSFDNEAGIEDAQGGGIRGAYHFKAKHALEIEIDSATSDARLPLPPGIQPATEFDTVKYSLNYVRNLFIKGHEKAIPYTSFGVGMIETDNGTASADSTFYLIGGGVRFWSTEHFGLRFGGKMYRWRGDGIIAPSKGFFSFDITIGATFLFGGVQ